MIIELYTPSNRSEWNELVGCAKNSHFMFSRDYMEYHKDRFIDFSLMARTNNGELVAIMPPKMSSFSLFNVGIV